MKNLETDFQQHLALEHRLERELVTKHAGQWVGIREHRVIAKAESAERLHEQLAQDPQPYRSFRVVPDGGITSF